MDVIKGQKEKHEELWKRLVAERVEGTDNILSWAGAVDTREIRCPGNFHQIRIRLQEWCGLTNAEGQEVMRGRRPSHRNCWNMALSVLENSGVPHAYGEGLHVNGIWTHSVPDQFE